MQAGSFCFVEMIDLWINGGLPRITESDGAIFKKDYYQDSILRILYAKIVLFSS